MTAIRLLSLSAAASGSTALAALVSILRQPEFDRQLVTKFQVNNLNPSTTQFVPNYNGTGSEFDFTFLRSD
jgi:hypothetical protein